MINKQEGAVLFLWEIPYIGYSDPGSERFVDADGREHRATEVIGCHRAMITGIEYAQEDRGGVIHTGELVSAVLSDGMPISAWHPFTYWNTLRLTIGSVTREFFDAVTTYNRMQNDPFSLHGLFVDSGGELMVPTFEGVEMCTRHDMAYRTDMSDRCPYCEIEGLFTGCDMTVEDKHRLDMRRPLHGQQHILEKSA